MSLGKGYGAMEGMSSEKINKPLNVITANEIGEIGGKDSLDAIS